MIAAGRSPALFAVVAGISLALMTGGRHGVRGPAYRSAAADISIRAMLIGVLGLALGSVVSDIEVILPYYAVFFLAAIALLRLRPLAVIAVAAGAMLTWSLTVGGADGVDDPNPTFLTVVQDPMRLAARLFVTGPYPAAAYLAYIGAGVTIGRLNLASRRVAGWLFGGGIALASAAWYTSSLLLFHAGGLRHLRDAAPHGLDPTRATNRILWDPVRTSSWWWLAVRAPHSLTPIDLLQALGSAMAVLGAVLLLMRLRTVDRILRPVAIAGSMTLTVYCAHALVLQTGLLSDEPGTLFVAMVAVTLVFAVLWRRWRRQGPLETVVTATTRRLRRTAAESCLRRPSRKTAEDQVCRHVVVS